MESRIGDDILIVLYFFQSMIEMCKINLKYK